MARSEPFEKAKEVDTPEWDAADPGYEINVFEFFGRWATGLSVMDGESIRLTFIDDEDPVTVPIIPGVIHPFNIKTIHKVADGAGNPSGIVIYG